MLVDGASVADVCHKPHIKFTIEPDRTLADRLNPARDDWQQIYHLLQAQKATNQEHSGVHIFLGIVCGTRNRRYMHLYFVNL